jgi:hypothetical protein
MMLYLCACYGPALPTPLLTTGQLDRLHLDENRPLGQSPGSRLLPIYDHLLVDLVFFVPRALRASACGLRAWAAALIV